jgi:hypothetical protein
MRIRSVVGTPLALILDFFAASSGPCLGGAEGRPVALCSESTSTEG